MKVALCVCGRLGNRYVSEYVKHYKNLGFDHIYIGDNNRDGEENFKDVLQSDIDENFVTLYDYRHLTAFTDLIYTYFTDMYNKLSNEYDWIAFFDMDEFLTLVKDTNIKDYLSRKCFKNANQILINWKTYTDNDLIYDDGRPCLERFTTPMDINKHAEPDEYNWIVTNELTKCIIRTNIKDAKLKTNHLFANNILEDTTYNSEGYKVSELQPWQHINYNFAYIKHFPTKTIEEWVHNKMMMWGNINDNNVKKLYDIKRFFKYNKITPEKINYLKKHNIDTSAITMKVALCVIGKLENRYAPEFVDYYRNLGFDHIYIGDNNDEDSEHFEDVLQSDIDENFVNIVNLRGLGFQQYNFYIDMYNKLSNEYDWIAFFDMDEFLTLVKDTNIKDYLSRECFKNTNQILINWKLYTDNDLIYDDGRSCLERFTTPMDINKYVQYGDIKENQHIKCIVRTKIANVKCESVHYLSAELLENTTYNNCGTKIMPDTYQEINYELSYIKHFFTKTIDEFINNRIKKWVKWDFHNFVFTLNNFFKVNNLTQEKINYLIQNGYNVDDLTKQLK